VPEGRSERRLSWLFRASGFSFLPVPRSLLFGSVGGGEISLLASASESTSGATPLLFSSCRPVAAPPWGGGREARVAGGEGEPCSGTPIARCTSERRNIFSPCTPPCGMPASCRTRREASKEAISARINVSHANSEGGGRGTGGGRGGGGERKEDTNRFDAALRDSSPSSALLPSASSVLRLS